jgi:hypothetical protein
MKIPEPFFILINPAMRLLLASPLHWLLSSSVLLIRFRGRKSGREFTTPVRYIRSGPAIQCFTGRTNQWWRNMREGAEVSLVIKGLSAPYTMTAIQDPEKVATSLAKLLEQFPQDAPYYEIVSPKGSPISEAQLRSAAARTVLVQGEQLA